MYIEVCEEGSLGDGLYFTGEGMFSGDLEHSLSGANGSAQAVGLTKGQVWFGCNRIRCKELLLPPSL